MPQVGSRSGHRKRNYVATEKLGYIDEMCRVTTLAACMPVLTERKFWFDVMRGHPRQKQYLIEKKK